MNAYAKMAIAQGVACFFTILAIAALAAMCSGCALKWSTPAQLSPAGPAEWYVEVEAAAEEWNTALAVTSCGRVFEMGDVYQVILYQSADWPYPEGYVGVTRTGGVDSDGWGLIEAGIAVLDRGHEGNRITLIHELGHALGLPHNNHEPSVMNPDSYESITLFDVENAADTLGCAP